MMMLREPRLHELQNSTCTSSSSSSSSSAVIISCTAVFRNACVQLITCARARTQQISWQRMLNNQCEMRSDDRCKCVGERDSRMNSPGGRSHRSGRCSSAGSSSGVFRASSCSGSEIRLSESGLKMKRKWNEMKMSLRFDAALEIPALPLRITAAPARDVTSETHSKGALVRK